LSFSFFLYIFLFFLFPLLIPPPKWRQTIFSWKVGGGFSTIN
jgi:hypothetical protein